MSVLSVARASVVHRESSGLLFSKRSELRTVFSELEETELKTNTERKAHSNSIFTQS